MTTFELHIHRLPDTGLGADARLGGEAASILASDIPIVLDTDALRALSSDPAAYERLLSAQIFAEPRLRDAWLKARAYAAAGALHLRLRVDASAAHILAPPRATLPAPAFEPPAWPQATERGRPLLAAWEDAARPSSTVSALRHALRTIAPTLLSQGYADPMMPGLRRAIARLRRLRDYGTLGHAMILLGWALNDRAAYAGALSITRAALRHLQLASDLVGQAAALAALGQIAVYRGAYASAHDLFQQALALRERTLGPDHPDTASTIHALGSVAALRGDDATAHDLFQQALALRERTLGPDHPATARTVQALGNLALRQGDPATARGQLLHALLIQERALGPDHPTTASTIQALGNAAAQLGDAAVARAHLRRALAAQERALGPEHPDTAHALLDLGIALMHEGEHTAARPLLERAYGVFQCALGAGHPSSTRAAHALGRLAHQSGPSQ